MSEKKPQSSSLQSAITNSADPRWDNKLSQQVDSASIDSASIEFDKGVTPFVETEDEVVDEKQLQHHQQQVADEIQLQLTGAMGSVSDNSELLLQPNQPIISGNAWQRFVASVSNSRYTTLAVILIHVFVITIALIFGRVNISGMTEVPVTDEQTTKPLPPLKSYLITQAEYDKLVERAQSNAVIQDTESESEKVPESGMSKEMDGPEIESESAEPIIN
jgi:hypothetical protein